MDARALRVDRAREEPLACACFAEDEHGRVRRGHTRREVEEPLHRLARTDDALERKPIAHRTLEAGRTCAQPRLVERTPEEELELVELEGFVR